MVEAWKNRTRTTAAAEAEAAEAAAADGADDRPVPPFQRHVGGRFANMERLQERYRRSHSRRPAPVAPAPNE